MKAQGKLNFFLSKQFLEILYVLYKNFEEKRKCTFLKFWKYMSINKRIYYIINDYLVKLFAYFFIIKLLNSIFNKKISFPSQCYTEIFLFLI